MSNERTATVTTHYDGGGGNKVDVPESEWAGSREVVGPDGSKYTEAEVIIGYDGGGKITETVRVNT